MVKDYGGQVAPLAFPVACVPDTEYIVPIWSKCNGRYRECNMGTVGLVGKRMENKAEMQGLKGEKG